MRDTLFKKTVDSLLDNSIDELSINDQNLSSQQSERLIKGLKQNTSLTTLSITNDYLVEHEIKGLVEAINNHIHLTTLRLDDNHINDRCTSYFLELIDTNKILTTLSLKGNFLSEESLHLLTHSALHRNTTLMQLNLHTNMKDNGIAKFVDEFLAKRRDRIFFGLFPTVEYRSMPTMDEDELADPHYNLGVHYNRYC